MTNNTLDATTLGPDVALSNGDLTATCTGTSGPDTGAMGLASNTLNSGLVYFEVTMSSGAGGDTGCGICTPTSTYPGLGGSGVVGAMIFRGGGGDIFINGSLVGSIATVHDGDVIGIAVNFNTNLIWFINLTQGSGWNQTSGSNDPAAGTGGLSFPSGSYVPGSSFNRIATVGIHTYNFGDSAFFGTAPVGFSVWSGGTPPPPAPIVGDLNAIEAADVMTFTGNIAATVVMRITENPDVFSAFGRQPQSGVMTVSEAPDKFAGTGIGLGEDGTWFTTEAPDIFAGIGNVPIAGTFNTTETADRFFAIGAGATQVTRRRSSFVT